MSAYYVNLIVINQKLGIRAIDGFGVTVDAIDQRMFGSATLVV